MKKVVLFAAVLVGVSLASCANKKAEEANTENVAIEATAEEIVVEDSISTDSILTDTIDIVEVAVDSVPAK